MNKSTYYQAVSIIEEMEYINSLISLINGQLHKPDTEDIKSFRYMFHLVGYDEAMKLLNDRYEELKKEFEEL